MLAEDLQALKDEKGEQVIIKINNEEIRMITDLISRLNQLVTDIKIDLNSLLYDRL
ncbi:MAG: hypothetical protein P4L35_12675 [Ignavibacteriaceae bacterium]|nr:hypothetical protein [Ignavibacteriaceae bacterium]